MSSSGGGSRVSIPEHLRKTIQDIKDITGKQHTDEDVFAMLKECGMDPNETVQKLMYLDTFHEVKSKKDRRREISNNKVPESNFASDGRGRGPRGNRNFPSGIRSGVKAQLAQREKRGNNFTDRASGGPTSASQQKSKDNTASNVIKPSTVAANGPPTLSNGVSGPPQAPDSPVKDVSYAVEASASGVSSALDPVIVPVLHWPSGAGPVKREIGVKRLPSGNSVYKKKVSSKIDAIEKDPHPQSTSTDDGLSTIKQQSPVKDNAPVNDGSVTSVPVAEIIPKVASVSIESNSQSLPAPAAVSDSQLVTFPNHFQVSEAFKNGLTFGSFDATFATRTESINGPVADNKTNSITEPYQGSGATVEECSPSNQSGDHVHEVPLPSEEEPLKTASFASEDPKPDTLLPPEVPQHPAARDIPSNTFGFISPILGPPTMQPEISETQARDISHSSYFNNGTVPAVSSPTLTAQSSMPVPPQQIPIYRPPYPINYFPYGPYLTPIYMSPIHQLLGHNAAFQQPPAGNLYLPQAVAAAGGVKIPFPMYKPGNNATPIGIPSGYSPYGSTSMAYAASPAVTSGTSASNEDLAASQLKENHIYSTAQLSEAPAVWIPPMGQDLSSLQVNSLYNLQQGQQITFSPAQAGHGAFGMQQPPQTIAGAPSVHPLLQQSQAGTLDTVGLPSGGAYQLPQHAQINWNTNF